MKIGVVHWRDAMTNRGQIQRYIAEAMNPMPMVTVGVLVKEDDNVIILAQDYIEDEDDGTVDFRAVSLIPKVNVTKIEILESQ